MNDENCVMFKGTKNGLVVLLNSEIDFDTLKKYLKKKTKDAKAFFKGAKVSLTFKGRTLNEEEQYELLKIISEQTELNISYIYDEEDSINDTENISVNSKFRVDKTKYYKGTIRSGQCIKTEESIVIIGDVNPGGEIIAGGNIIILGALKGIVHAGSIGDEKAFVAALNMKPMQLRIGSIIARAPDNKDIIDNSKAVPQIAYLHNGNIYIEPIDYKTLGNL
ncbi:septum site-determining protein MinC [Defluviitalea phaphyphila]|uniref:septum site-determining protein MinC n=1 Tax=Defluviitalea phaphyphila TaxID=1473580 RepID=UPI000731BC49|nr:septum site-determining protein MinC [Defluviitalea phaphyphila]